MARTMSAAAAWSYTATATVWPLLARDAWRGGAQYGPPQAFACDYSTKTSAVRDARGDEFTVAGTFFTERADLKPGDRVMLGRSTAADPVAAGAREVRAVQRDADVFDRQRDDFRVMVG